MWISPVPSITFAITGNCFLISEIFSWVTAYSSLFSRKLLTAFSQAHNNVAVDFRESILQPGSKINICVTHDYNCNARVYTKMNAGLKSMGSPDLLVLFTSTISHTMVRCALRETRGEHVRVARSHTSSMAALRGILERHIVQEEA